MARLAEPLSTGPLADPKGFSVKMGKTVVRLFLSPPFPKILDPPLRVDLCAFICKNSNNQDELFA